MSMAEKSWGRAPQDGVGAGEHEITVVTLQLEKQMMAIPASDLVTSPDAKNRLMDELEAARAATMASHDELSVLAQNSREVEILACYLDRWEKMKVVTLLDLDRPFDPARIAASHSGTVPGVAGTGETL